ncbi:MAG: hypothetical protein HYR97_01915 [Candidatus Melainabacteria bacterium]|nr:hypothetical protein [Candidatus Melainabacteria bacterium]
MLGQADAKEQQAQKTEQEAERALNEANDAKKQREEMEKSLQNLKQKLQELERKKAQEGAGGVGSGSGSGDGDKKTQGSSPGSGSGSKGSGGGGSGGGDKPGLGNGQGMLQAAKAILRQIGLIAINMISPHPIPNIAKNETNQKLARLAISYLDAAQVDSALSGTTANQDIIFTRTQATTIEGDAQTAKQYWVQALNADKQSNKDTHKLADRA